MRNWTLPGLFLVTVSGLALFAYWALRIKFYKLPHIRIVTFTGPSGSGKTTIVGELLKLHPDWKMIISLTSRNPRESDLPGEYQCRVRLHEFLRRGRKGEFLWMVSPHGYHYGTLLADVQKALASDGPWLMNITPEAVKKLHDLYPGQVLSFFILPPGEEELRKRLENRGEPPEAVEKRIADCRKWEEEARASGLTYQFVTNDGTVAEAVEKVDAIIKSRI